MFIVAEASANHGGSLEKALQIIKAAADSGADAVKFQTFQADRMVGNPYFVIESGPWEGRKLIDLYREAETPREWHKPMFDYARDLGIVPFSTPFSNDDVDFLETLDCQIYKIASFEIVDLDLINYVASKGKQIIISTGMATSNEIANAVYAAKEHLDSSKITILQCTSAYPAIPEEANLSTIVTLGKFLKVRHGLSDHTFGGAVACAAAALGATVIEKHLTLFRADGGPDAGFSLEPHEFAKMIKDVRDAEASTGHVFFGMKPSESSSYALRRSLWWARDVKAGHIVTDEDIICARPGNGLHPYLKHTIVGKPADSNHLKGTPV